MDWTNTISEIVSRYSGQSGGTAAAPQDPHADFQRVAQAAPRDVVAGGISQALRSDQTPPFSEMLANLFTHSDPGQRAGLVNRLLTSIGPGGISSIPGMANLSSLINSGTVTAAQASQVSADQVQQIAAHAERQNPAVVDQVSAFLAQHPQVMKAVGGMALTIALQHMIRRS